MKDIEILNETIKKLTAGGGLPKIGYKIALFLGTDIVKSLKDLCFIDIATIPDCNFVGTYFGHRVYEVKNSPTFIGVGFQIQGE